MSITSLTSPHRQRPAGCQGFLTELLLRCAQGDEAALGRLFDVLHPLVRAIVAVDPASDDPDGVLVDAFRHLWLGAPSYDPAVWSSVDWVIDQVREAVGAVSSAGARCAS